MNVVGLRKICSLVTGVTNRAISLSLIVTISGCRHPGFRDELTIASSSSLSRRLANITRLGLFAKLFTADHDILDLHDKFVFLSNYNPN